MSQTFVESLNITNVYQQKVNDRNYQIHFTVNELSYFLFIQKRRRDNMFVPGMVSHEEVGYCTFCHQEIEETDDWCEQFEPYLNELFYRLIEQPSIRLEWLYMPHALQA